MRALSVDPVLSRLAYAGVFAVGLTQKQLYATAHTHVRISQQKIDRMIKKLEQKRLCRTQGEFVFLTSDRKKQKKFLTQVQLSKRKRGRLQKLLWLFSWNPWVLAVVVTGSVAAGTPKPTDDIDVMIICSQNRLWLCRLSLLPLLFFRGVLRQGNNHQVTDKLCLNLWLEPSVLQFSASLYIAQEIAQTQWLYAQPGVKEKFLNENRWIKQYLANTAFPQVRPRKRPQSPQISRTLNALNVLAFKLQFLYMSGHKTTEVVEFHRALFHPRQTHSSVLRSFETLYKQLRRQYNRSL